LCAFFNYDSSVNMPNSELLLTSTVINVFVTDMNNTAKLIISIAIPLLVAATAGYFTATGTGSWYRSIKTPSWNPPDWVFGPVWTILYILMGISLFLVWKNDKPVDEKRMALLFFALQLLFNFCWSFIFFNQHQVGLAFIDIVVLWICLLATIIFFSQINNTAAWLLVPYIAWVSFAGILNYTIWKLN
jgi:translocator protein